MSRAPAYAELIGISVEILDFAWLFGWLIALWVLICFALATAQRSQLADRYAGARLAAFAAIVIVLALLAQTALRQHDVHLDLTRARTFTADKTALEFIDNLQAPITVTYFGHEGDPAARRIMTILDSFQFRSPMLTVATTDPDKDPVLARRYGVQFYNVAVVEAGEQRVLAKTTSEVDIVIAMQKALREKVTRLCFVNGHGEAELYNEEFHTHIESLGGGSGVDHHHGHAHIPLVQSTSHGIGRLRRSLDALGYETRPIKLTAARTALDSCDVVSVVQPKFAFAPSEIKKLEQGQSKLIFKDKTTVNLMSGSANITEDTIRQLFNYTGKYPYYIQGVTKKGDNVIYKVNSIAVNQKLLEQNKVFLPQMMQQNYMQQLALLVDNLKNEYSVSLKLNKI